MKKWGFIRENRTFVYFLVAALFLRLLLTQFGTFESDFDMFVRWSDRLVEVGPEGFYEETSDYTPGYLYVLWLLGSLKAQFPFLGQKFMAHLLYKLPAIFADIATGILIFFAVSKFNKKFALPAAAFYIFNPAVFGNSAMWGQVDSITSFFVVAAVFFASSNPVLAVLALALGTLVKPQAGFIAPLIGVLWILKFGWLRAFVYSLFTAVAFLAGFLPFSADKPLLPFVLERLAIAAGQFPFASINAFNAWILGNWKPDAGWPQLTGIIITLLVSIFALWLLWRKEKRDPANAFPFRFLAAAVILAGSFLFLTRMHERHLLAALAPLVVSAAAFPLLWLPYVVFSLTYMANLRFAYVWLTKNHQLIFPNKIVVLISIVNVVVFFMMSWVLFNPKRRLSDSVTKFLASMKKKLSKLEPHESVFVKRHWRVFLAVILLFALLTRLYGLGHPPGFYYDEVYHAFAATEIAKGNPDAWVWYGKAPEGRAFAWDHPPISKLGMAAGIAIFGERAIGWRFPNALLGVGSVFLVYLVGFALLRNRTVSIFGAAIFALDGLPLVLSRIGMNDIYFLFFALGTIYFLIKDSYLLSAIFLGLAGASKWSAIWLIPVLVIMIFLLKKRIGLRLGWFVVIPPVVYILSYTPFFMTGHTVAEFIELHEQTWWYHTTLQATHAYSSPWWSWPLMLKPVSWYAHSENDLVSRIYAQGNPAIFWIGFAAVIATFVIAIFSKRRELWVLLVAYAGLFVPWSISPRIMFLYHYLPSVPFLSIMLAWVLVSNRRWKLTSIVFLIFAFLIFLLVYPRLIGIPVAQSFYLTWYAWLPH